MAKPTEAKKKSIEARILADRDREEELIPLTHQWRPRTLDQYAGQQAVLNAVEDAFSKGGRVPKAWLLEGPTGTGKTTTARLISMRINCENPAGANPCLKCDSCKRYLTYPAPSHPCHIEVNASADNGIDKVRDLISQTHYNVMVGKCRVVLLDEPQGLSTPAQNALLKALEDPQNNTIWILATTHPGKLLSALIGRCRAGHLKIRPPSTQELSDRLRHIGEAEGIKIDKKWYKKIAIASNHQPRDAVAVLEQVINASRRRKNVDLEKMLPRIVDEVQSGSPDRVAMDIIAGVLSDNAESAHASAKQSGLEAHILIGALVRAWNQVLLSCVSRKLLEPYYAQTLFRVFADNGVTVSKAQNPALIRGGEYLARQYERSKAFIVPSDFLITLTISGLWETCGPVEE